MNMSNITGWAKSHPWTTGAVVIGGGLTFILLSGWFTGGSSGGDVVVNQAGQSDAEIAASAQLASQQLAAQTQNYQTNAQLEIAKLQAGVVTKQTELDYLAHIADVQAGKEITALNIASQQSIAEKEIRFAQTKAERDQYDYQTGIRLAYDQQLYALQSQERITNQLLERIPMAQVG